MTDTTNNGHDGSLSRVHSVKQDVTGCLGLLNDVTDPDKGLYAGNELGTSQSLSAGYNPNTGRLSECTEAGTNAIAPVTRCTK